MSAHIAALDPHVAGVSTATIAREIDATDERALAVAVVRRALDRAELAGASAGAPLAFTQLCVALSEASGAPDQRALAFAGLGRVSWTLHAECEDLIVFVLTEEADAA
ncbi:MAG: hypothetical protein H7124_04200 [Phycisphaerales bacterium]|nr:hypothetical protein [Hyphomonadaceae bacterium]